MTADTDDSLIRERIDAWKTAAPGLESSRRREIVEADTAKAIITLEGPFQSALIHHKLRPTSGLVQLQEIFRILAGRQPPDALPQRDRE